MSKPGLKPGQKAAVGAGRKAGTPNKSTVELQQAIAAVCGEDWDPVVAMARIAKEGVIPTLNSGTGTYVDIPVSEKTRATCHKEVAEYIHAKRRAVEVSNDPENPLSLGLAISFVDPE